MSGRQTISCVSLLSGYYSELSENIFEFVAFELRGDQAGVDFEVLRFTVSSLPPGLQP